MFMVLRARSERIEEHLESFDFRKQKGRALFVDYVPAPQNRVLGIDDEVISAGERPILRDAHLSVFRGDKIRIAGPNGIGKTTLLKAMVENARSRLRDCCICRRNSAPMTARRCPTRSAR